MVGSHRGERVESLAVRPRQPIRRPREGGGVAGRAAMSEARVHVLEQLCVRCGQVVLAHLALEGRELLRVRVRVRVRLRLRLRLRVRVRARARVS